MLYEPTALALTCRYRLWCSLLIFLASVYVISTQLSCIYWSKSARSAFE